PPEFRLRFHPRDGVRQTDVSEESRRETATAEFNFGVVPNTDKVGPSLLEIEAEAIRGAVETYVEHSLRWTPLGWRDKVTFQVNPVRERVGELAIDLPSGFEYDGRIGPVPLEMVERVDIVDAVPGRRRARVKLVRETGQRFNFTLCGTYSMAETQQ